MLKKHANRDGSAQKSSVIIWKCLIQDHAAAECKERIQAQSLFFSRTNWSHLRAAEPTAMQTVPYIQLLTEQQRAAWFTDGSSKVNGAPHLEGHNSD